MLMKWDKRELEFKPSVPRMFYNRQIMAMNDYIKVLEERARIEKIDLTQYKI